MPETRNLIECLLVKYYVLLLPCESIIVVEGCV